MALVFFILLYKMAFVFFIVVQEGSVFLLLYKKDLVLLIVVQDGFIFFFMYTQTLLYHGISFIEVFAYHMNLRVQRNLAIACLHPPPHEP